MTFSRMTLSTEQNKRQRVTIGMTLNDKTPILPRVNLPHVILPHVNLAHVILPLVIQPHVILPHVILLIVMAPFKSYVSECIAHFFSVNVSAE